MNLEYLGDALDHWKGSLFDFLQSERILRHFAVDPMATDRAQWNDADFCLYARLLHINRDQIIQHKAPLLFRDRYFSEIKRDVDVFLDPDTGIGVGSPIEKYVKPKDLASLLRSASVALWRSISMCGRRGRVNGSKAASPRLGRGLMWLDGAHMSPRQLQCYF